MASGPHHVPVLLAETVELLAPQRGGCFVDCTVGLGGHAEAILAAGATRLLGLDRDPEALRRARARLEPWGERVELVEATFDQLEEVLRRRRIPAVDGILADLGVSSLQLDTPERGFSFQRDGPLDMRMGKGERTAEEVVNEASEEVLTRILKEYGEEPAARRIARAIVERRTETPIRTTADLRELVARAKPVRGPRRRDPATQVFQALRIEVNQELAGLERLLDQATELLAPEGRLVVISYHSLEDRRVKNVLRDLARGRIDRVTGQTLPDTRMVELLTRRPLTPSPEEVEANPRSRSAKLRAARRLP